MDSFVVGIVKEKWQAESIVNRLGKLGLPANDVSVLAPSDDGGALGDVRGQALGPSLVARGIPERAAKRYELRVRAGHMLVTLHTASHEDARRATAIFKSEGADEIYSTVEPPRANDTLTQPRGVQKANDDLDAAIRRAENEGMPPPPVRQQG